MSVVTDDHRSRLTDEATKSFPRGALIRWNKKASNCLALLHPACAVITYRSAGLFG